MDEVGTELANIAAVRQQALMTSGELLRESASDFWTGKEWTMHVLDEAGSEVLTLRFSASLNGAGAGLENDA